MNFSLITSLVVLSVFTIVAGNVSQCYLCNSQFCGDPYDTKLGGISSCSDLYKNAKVYSSKLVDSEHSVQENSGDVETVTHMQNTAEPLSARFFDIDRKIWEFFNKGEINENTQFVCVKASYNSGNQIKTYRGCVPKSTKSISTACDFVNQKVIEATSSSSSSPAYTCYTCENNLCNSGTSLTVPFLTVAIYFIMKFTVI